MIVTTPPPEYPEHEPGARAFGRTIRARRVAAGLTLMRCSYAVGMSMTALSEVEQGRSGFTPLQREQFEKAVSKANNSAANAAGGGE